MTWVETMIRRHFIPVTKIDISCLMHFSGDVFKSMLVTNCFESMLNSEILVTDSPGRWWRIPLDVGDTRFLSALFHLSSTKIFFWKLFCNVPVLIRRDLRRAKLSCSYCFVFKPSNFDFGAAISFFVNKCILGNVSVFLTLFWPENTILAAFFYDLNDASYCF